MTDPLLALVVWEDATEHTAAASINGTGLSTCRSVGYVAQSSRTIEVTASRYDGDDHSQDGSVLVIPRAWVKAIYRIECKGRVTKKDIPRKDTAPCPR